MVMLLEEQQRKHAKRSANVEKAQNAAAHHDESGDDLSDHGAILSGMKKPPEAIRGRSVFCEVSLTFVRIGAVPVFPAGAADQHED